MQAMIWAWTKGVALGLPMIFAWLYGVFQSTKTWLVVLLIVYFIAPKFGVVPLGPLQVAEVFIQKPDSWMAVVTIVVGIVAAGSFMASKRLDMRLAAADEIQDLLKRMTDVATEERLAAESLVSFRQYAARFPQGTLSESAAQEMRRVGAALLVTVTRVSKDQGRMWTIYKEAVALQSRHRLAISSSSVSSLMFSRGLSKLEKLASSRAWIYPLEPEKLDDLFAWCADPRSEWVEGYSAVALKLAEQVSVCLGASAGAVAGTLFPTSAVAAWNSWIALAKD